jgi:hypothetical protein
MSGNVTYDPEMIRGAAMYAANQERAKMDADRMYNETFTHALTRKKAAPKKAAKKRKTIRKRRNNSSAGGFLNAFGNWSRNTQNNLFSGGDFSY